MESPPGALPVTVTENLLEVIRKIIRTMGRGFGFKLRIEREDLRSKPRNGAGRGRTTVFLTELFLSLFPFFPSHPQLFKESLSIRSNRFL